MGLDAVELLMYVEAEFDIEVDDVDVGGIVTVGDLHSCVMRKLATDDKLQSGNAGPGQVVWERRSGILVTRLGVEAGKISTGARIARDLGIN